MHADGDAAAQLEAAHLRSRMAPLVIGAIGVVYGDIGTSPLYTLRQCFTGMHHLDLSPENILGILSIIFWALVIIVTLKYVTLIMRADNRGEGGILALTALVSRGLESKPRRRWWFVGFGIFGAAMFYGDGMITPAISVLGAVEGLGIITPQLHPLIDPIAIVIIVALFTIQRTGTARVGAFFGPIMCLWFVTLAVLGIIHVVERPAVLAAINPLHAIGFVVGNPTAAFLALGAVVLAVTGTEALYADMGHFGKEPIRRAWLFFVMPALVLNYFGQGALLLGEPTAIKNPFYLLAPTWALVPLVILATCAAVIASQAVISGAFSLTRAAIQMGYCPRLTIDHTSEREIGQIYVPFVNWVLFTAVILLVVGFRHSDNLGGAYGIAVTLAMLIDSILIMFVMRQIWHWPTAVAIAIALPLATIDLAFLSSNLLKVPSGGWFPIVVGISVFTLLTTWKKGRSMLMRRMSDGSMPLDLFIESIEADPPARVPGTAVFLTSAVNSVPNSLLHNLKHNKVLHERVVFLTIVSRDVPYITADERYEVKSLGEHFSHITAYYGFSEDVDVPRLLDQCGRGGLAFKMMETSFFVSRETLIATGAPGMAKWRERLFVSMSKNATKASDFFAIPTNRVVELGTQVEI
jgi:KUP system potassium uptake protein